MEKSQAEHSFKDPQTVTYICYPNIIDSVLTLYYKSIRVNHLPEDDKRENDLRWLYKITRDQIIGNIKQDLVKNEKVVIDICLRYILEQNKKLKNAKPI